MHKAKGLSPLCIKLPQFIGYFKHFDNDNRHVSFSVNDKILFKKYNEKCDKIENLPKKN